MTDLEKAVINAAREHCYAMGDWWAARAALRACQDGGLDEYSVAAAREAEMRVLVFGTEQAMREAVEDYEVSS